MLTSVWLGRHLDSKREIIIFGGSLKGLNLGQIKLAKKLTEKRFFGIWSDMQMVECSNGRYWSN
jgi:hypothetical protein